jgi:hypothetical protein
MDPLETFRANFFAKVVKEKHEAEAALKRKQRICFHKYELVSGVKVCKKCTHMPKYK